MAAWACCLCSLGLICRFNCIWMGGSNTPGLFGVIWLMGLWLWFGREVERIDMYRRGSVSAGCVSRGLKPGFVG
jgi:hypothetical protein